VSRSVPAWSYWTSPTPPEQRKDGMYRYDLPDQGRNAFTLAQTEEIPEKVHTLQPLAYEHRANTNKPNIRTTFYNKKAGVWMEEKEMLL